MDNQIIEHFFTQKARLSWILKSSKENAEEFWEAYFKRRGEEKRIAQRIGN